MGEATTRAGRTVREAVRVLKQLAFWEASVMAKGRRMSRLQKNRPYTK
jgi:hypothetical protein